MRLLEKYVPFYCDDQVQQSFKSLKKYLMIDPLLSPLYFNRYFVLYLAAFDTTIGLLLVQEDKYQKEHPIYYLS